MIKERLEELKLPDVLGGAKTVTDWEKRREEIKKILQDEEYGYLPPKPEKFSYKLISTDNRFCAGKAPLKKYEITVKIMGENFTFPFCFVVPEDGENIKTVLHINFRDAVPDKYMLTEELIDNNIAVASFCYNDITHDNNDFTDGLAGIIYKDKFREGSTPGKIMMWAWAAMRVMDFLQVCDEKIDKEHITVAGHSRLGKTALVTAAFDERFYMGYSNNSGTGGDSISRDKIGEHIADINHRFEYWFCDNYKKYNNNENIMPFDQHFLLSLIAPRHSYVASAEEDSWADPKAQFLCCNAANPVYDLYGLKGIITPDQYPAANSSLHEGNIGYHIRKGCHYFSRYDWLEMIKYIHKHF